MGAVGQFFGTHGSCQSKSCEEKACAQALVGIMLFDFNIAIHFQKILSKHVTE